MLPLAVIGKGILAWSNMNNATQSVKNMVRAQNQHVIVRIAVCREPLHPAYQAILRRLPGNTVGNQTLWHLSVILLFDNGSSYKLEKNEIVEASPCSFPPASPSCIVLTVPHIHTAQSFIDHAIECAPSSQAFWRYNARDANCQWFVLWCLQGAGVHVGNGAVRDFVLQSSVPTMLTQSSWHALQGVTDIANFGRRILGANALFRAQYFQPYYVTTALIKSKPHYSSCHMQCASKLCIELYHHISLCYMILRFKRAMCISSFCGFVIAGSAISTTS